MVMLRARGTFFLAAGSLLIAGAGLASGLLGPDSQEYVGAPGSAMVVRELGTLRFPLIDARPQMLRVVIRRSTRETEVPVRGQAYVGAFILWQRLRPVVQVDVFDEGRNHLTITQPSNAAFLSPVLLFARKASVAGKMLPVDSFVLPAKHTVVKAVLLDAAQLGAMQHRLSNGPAVLFAVQSEAGVLLRNGMKIVTSGTTETIGGLTIRTMVRDYPAVDVASAPHPALLIPGLILFAGGLIRSRFRS